jgi:aminopeptidase
MENSFAQLLADYCLEVTPGQTIWIEAQAPALPLIESLSQVLLQRGAYPIVTLPTHLNKSFYETPWVQGPPETLMAMAKQADATLRVESAADPLELSSVAPEVLARYTQNWKALRALRAHKRWCLTLYPTAGYAKQVGWSLEEFRSFVEKALYLDRPDPVAAWKDLSAFQAELIGRLKTVKQIRIEAPGTQLSLEVGGRTWLNSDGKRNMPSGEIFTGPLETSATGQVYFNLPSVVSGQRVSGVTLRFEAGKVVHAAAEEGEAYLLKMLETDQGARFLGELGIGTNFGIQQATGIILYDEKIGGSVHLALGQSYPETSGTNVSAIHWDLVLDLRKEGRILADGIVVQENGVFK